MSDQAVSKFQTFVNMRVHRSQLKNAPYNARQIDAAAKKKLKESLSLKRGGLVVPLTWNKRTGNLVAGHQRIEALDVLEGQQDYWLDVAAIDVDEKTEKELSIRLNNPAVGGSYDLERLALILPEIELEASGFDLTEISLMLPELDLVPSKVFAEVDPAQPTIQKIQNIKARRQEYKAQEVQKDSTEYYSVLVWPDADTMAKFLSKAVIPEGERFHDGPKTMTNLGVDL